MTAAELAALEARYGELEAIWPLTPVQQGILTHAGSDLKAVIDPLRTKHKKLPIGLWLAPGNHPMVERHPLSDLATQLFGSLTTPQAENLFETFQDAYGAHGVLQAVAAAKWLARSVGLINIMR